MCCPCWNNNIIQNNLEGSLWSISDKYNDLSPGTIFFCLFLVFNSFCNTQYTFESVWHWRMPSLCWTSFYNMAGNTSCFLRIMCANFSLYFHRTSCFSSAHSMCKFHNASRISCSPHYSAHSDERSTYPLSLLNHLLFPIIILHWDFAFRQ